MDLLSKARRSWRFSVLKQVNLNVDFSGFFLNRTKPIVAADAAVNQAADEPKEAVRDEKLEALREAEAKTAAAVEAPKETVLRQLINEARRELPYADADTVCAYIQAAAQLRLADEIAEFRKAMQSGELAVTVAIEQKS